MSDTLENTSGCIVTIIALLLIGLVLFFQKSLNGNVGILIWGIIIAYAIYDLITIIYQDSKEEKEKEVIIKNLKDEVQKLSDQNKLYSNEILKLKSKLDAIESFSMQLKNLDFNNTDERNKTFLNYYLTEWQKIIDEIIKKRGYVKSEDVILLVSPFYYNIFEYLERRDDYYKQLKDNNTLLDYCATLHSDFSALDYELTAQYLESKIHPAPKKALEVRELKANKKRIEKQYKLMLYKYELLLGVFPELANYVDDVNSIKELEAYDSVKELQEDYDRVRDWIPKEEYEKLDIDTRNQLALERYINNYNKSSWQIGRDYEMYCGYLYRKSGWQVHQFGIEKKLEDMGRDIIAEKNNTIHIVQCKLWARDKTIHEKHIAQLYGSAIMYTLTNQISLSKVVPVFMTNIDLSETATKFAEKLGVLIIKREMKEFPRIKCNINASSFEKIYHLPFDQQYDRTKIDESKGEFYAFTVKEAVKAGFRRAFKHMRV